MLKDVNQIAKKETATKPNRIYGGYTERYFKQEMYFHDGLFICIWVGPVFYKTNPQYIICLF